VTQGSFEGRGSMSRKSTYIGVEGGRGGVFKKG